MVALSEEVLMNYVTLSLYNSPYPAHDDGSAIDLYPASGAPSPVAGEVLDTHTVRAPSKPYAAEHDHLIVIDAGVHLARVLHVDPSVEPGERVEIGEELGETVRSGYFAPWVDNHLHVGFREPDVDPYRASGSLPVSLDIGVTPVTWEGTGTVVERAETYVVLEEPVHPSPGETFAGIAASGGVLDGGLPHYSGGGLLGGASGTVWLAGNRVGTASGRTVAWDGVEVFANDTAVTGLSLALHRDRLGVKLVSWDGIPVGVGEQVQVEVQ